MDKYTKKIDEKIFSLHRGTYGYFIQNYVDTESQVRKTIKLKDSIGYSKLMENILSK